MKFARFVYLHTWQCNFIGCMKSVFLAVLLVFSNGLFCSETVYVKQQLAQMPEDDKYLLRLYFETLLAQNFAYTLFGDKPVSGDSYYAPAYGDNSMKNAVLRYGKPVWLKYCHLFSGGRFAFVYQQRGDFEDVYLINKKTVLDTVSMHLKEFQKALGNHVTPEIVLEQLMRTDTTYDEVLHNHGGLVGMMYGFGHTNAFLFYKITQLQTAIDKWLNPPFILQADDPEKIHQDPFHYFMDIALNPDTSANLPAELKALYGEYDVHMGYLNSFTDEDGRYLSTLCLFPLPTFGARIEHPETIALKERYNKTKQVCTQAYSQGDFLEVTLCKLLEK